MKFLTEYYNIIMTAVLFVGFAIAIGVLVGIRKAAIKEEFERYGKQSEKGAKVRINRFITIKPAIKEKRATTPALSPLNQPFGR
jgi:hypothetical protein